MAKNIIKEDKTKKKKKLRILQCSLIIHNNLKELYNLIIFNTISFLLLCFYLHKSKH